MTLEQLDKLDTEFLSIADVADYLGKNPQPIRESIRNGVPWGYVLGTATFKIPKRAFVNYHKYGSPIADKQ